MTVDTQVFPLSSQVLAQMAEAVIYADRSGVICYWNPAAQSMLGYSADEAVGQSLDLIIPENLRLAHWRGFDAAIQNGATRLNGRPTLTRVLHKSGDKRYVEMSFALVFGEAGLALGSVAVARDVTEKVEREKASRKAAGS